MKKNEADRVSAIKTAHELVQALEQPHEAVIKLGFAVRVLVVIFLRLDYISRFQR